MGKQWNSGRLYFIGLQNHCRWWQQPWNWMMLAPWKKSYDQPGQHIKKQRHHFSNKGPSNQSYGFSSSHVWMWKLDCKEALKNWRFWTVELRRLWRVPWTARKLNQSILKEISPDNSLERLAEAPVLCPPDAKSQLIRKYLDAGKDWRQEEKGMTEDEMVEWHYWLNGHEFKPAVAFGEE